VRRGVDEHLPGDNNTFLNVYGEMFIQICREYNTLPDPQDYKSARDPIFLQWDQERTTDHQRQELKCWVL